MRAARIASALLLLLAGLGLAAAGCDKKPDPEDPQPYGWADTSSSGKLAGADEKWQRCKLDEKIQAPEEGTPEHVLHALFQAAATAEDTPEAFQAFFGHFDSTFKERDVKYNYWKRFRKFLPKYKVEVEGAAEGEFVFHICDRIEQEGGKLKFFIKTEDPKKSNPPITLKKDDAGDWKVAFFTP